MKKFYWIILSLIMIVFFIFQYFYYSKEYIDVKSFQTIQDEYHLNLPEENWRYTKYTKNTFINKHEPMIFMTNFMIDDIFGSYNVTANIYTTKDQKFIDLMLPFTKNHREEMLNQTIQYAGFEIFIRVYTNPTNGLENINDDEYLPIYVFDFIKNDIKYRFEMISPDNSSFVYKKSEQKIHQDELNAYLKFIEKIIQ